MAVLNSDHDPRQARLHKVLARILAVTRWGLALFGLGAAAWLAMLLLPLWTGYLPPWRLMCAAMGFMLLGVWAEVWNGQCALVAAVLCHGCPRTITQIMRTAQAVRFGVQGRYAREHCGELASYLAVRRYRLVLFLLPHAWSVVVVVAFLTLLIAGGWPFN